MTCPKLPVTLEDCVATVYTREDCPDNTVTVDPGPAATGYIFDNPCCSFGALQILYGMPINTGTAIEFGSTS
jgi:hypothetical protein